jgi:LysM repeat protein
MEGRLIGTVISGRGRGTLVEARYAIDVPLEKNRKFQDELKKKKGPGYTRRKLIAMNVDGWGNLGCDKRNDWGSRGGSGIYPARLPVAGTEAVYYSTKSGDTLWSISDHLYGDAFAWPVLLRANRNIGRNPNFIRPNMRIIVPGTRTPETKIYTLRDDVVANGYIYVYELYRDLGLESAETFLQAAIRRDREVLERFPKLDMP